MSSFFILNVDWNHDEHGPTTADAGLYIDLGSLPCFCMSRFRQRHRRIDLASPSRREWVFFSACSPDFTFAGLHRRMR